MEKDNRREHYGEIASAVPRNDTVGGWTGVLTRIGWLGQIGGLTRLGGVFLSPVLMQDYGSENESHKNSPTQQDVNPFHNYSPLSAINPIGKKTENATNPPIKSSVLNFSGALNCPMTSAIKMYLLKSRKTFAKFSLCRLLNFISAIIQQINKFVKGDVAAPVFAVFVLFVILITGQIFAQEVNVKDKIRQLKHKNPAVRIQAVKDLGKEIAESEIENTKRKEIVDKLIETLKKDKDGFVRRTSAEALANTRDKTVIPELIETAKNDVFKDTRKTAILGLGQIQDESAVPTLKEIFVNEKEDMAICLMAGNSLSYIATKEVFEIFKQELGNGNPRIRLQSVVGLRNMLTGFMMKERIELLEKMLNDKDNRVKEVAEESLEKLQPVKTKE